MAGFVQTLEPPIFFAIFVAILVWTLWVCAKDARRRGKQPMLVVLLVLLSFPLGFVIWLLFRPEPLDVGPADFRLEDHRVQ